MYTRDRRREGTEFQKLKGQPLTQKEFNVAYLISHGHTYQRVAVVNRLSYHQVHWLTKIACYKLDVEGRLGLAKAREEGRL